MYVKLLIVIVTTLISGLADSQGFIHASRAWQHGTWVGQELVKSALGFQLGFIAYWLAIRYLKELGIVSAEAQTLLWFGVTIVGVAAVSGQFIRWQRIDQVAAVGVLAGIAWLLFRTGA